MEWASADELLIRLGGPRAARLSTEIKPDDAESPRVEKILSTEESTSRRYPFSQIGRVAKGRRPAP